MKRILVFLMFLLAAISLFADDASVIKKYEPIQWGNLVPANRLGGRMISSGFLRGKIVLVACRDFSTSESVNVLKELEGIWRAFKTKPFVLVGSHRGGDLETVKNRIKELGVTFPVYHEAKLLNNEPGAGWKGEFIYIVGMTGRTLYYGTDIKRSRAVIGSAVISSRVHSKPSFYAHYAEWELSVLPGRALNTLREFKKEFPREAMAFSEELSALENNDDIVKLAQLEKICRQSLDYDPKTRQGKKPLTADRVGLLIDHYSYLKTNSNERVSQEAKNCLAELIWLQATL